MIFDSREKAGKLLSSYINEYIKINNFDKQQLVVAFLPRGAIPIAYEIYKNLGLPIFAVITKKLSTPQKEEFAFGALAKDGTYFADENYMYYLGIDKEKLKEILEKTKEKIEKSQKYEFSTINNLKNKIVFLVDDGIATGFTAMVASKYLKKLGAKRVILAIPVCPAKVSKDIIDNLDDIICLNPIENFQAVGQFYKNFHQIEDDEYFNFKQKILGKNT